MPPHLRGLHGLEHGVVASLDRLDSPKGLLAGGAYYVRSLGDHVAHATGRKAPFRDVGEEIRYAPVSIVRRVRERKPELSEMGMVVRQADIRKQAFGIAKQRRRIRFRRSNGACV